MSSNLAVKELNYEDINAQELELNNIYHFSLFEPLDEKVKKEKKEKREARQEKKEVKAKEVSYIKTIAKIATAFMCVLSVFTFMLGLNAKRDEVATQISRIENEIKVAESEKIRLQSELGEKTAVSNLKEYAELTLGMVKLENYKITYLQSNEGNRVVISGGKSYDDTLWDKIKKTFT